MNKRLNKLLAYVVLCYGLILTCVSPTLASDLQHTRLLKDSEGRSISLDVAVTSFQKSGVTVDLIGAIHIADKSYFEKLNSLFQEYDKVLFELVAPEEHDFSSKKKGSDMYKPMADALGLVGQVEHIDYSVPNMVHADLSPKALKKAMEDGGQTFFDLFISVMRNGYKSQLKDYHKSQVASLKLLLGFLSPNRDRVLKSILAEQFADLDNQMGQLGEEVNSLIIEKRNIKALEVLEETLKAPSNKKIAIFYGAGHNKDFADRLVNQMGFRYSQQTWLAAWQL